MNYFTATVLLKSFCKRISTVLEIKEQFFTFHSLFTFQLHLFIVVITDANSNNDDVGDNADTKMNKKKMCNNTNR